MTEPPDYLYLPKESSSGSCYHAKVCSAHSLRKVPFEEAVPIIKRDSLTPCSNCQEHHGLMVMFNTND